MKRAETFISQDQAASTHDGLYNGNLKMTITAVYLHKQSSVYLYEHNTSLLTAVHQQTRISRQDLRHLTLDTHKFSVYFSKKIN